MESVKEIKLGEGLKEKLLAGVNTLSNVVTLTLGPNGNTVIIADEYGEPYITKDGVSVANYITLEDPVENIAATLLKQVAKKTVEEAGDGTTTSICLAQSLINKGFSLLEEGNNYNDLKKELEKLEEDTVDYLFTESKDLKKENIVNVATISANNDTNIGKLIQKAYNHSPIVKVEEGNKTEDELITINGMELDTGYLDNAFINVPSKEAIVYEDALVLIINGKLDKLDDIATLLRKVGEQPVVIIADHVHEQVRSILRNNYNSGALRVALVKSPGFAAHRKNLMKDLAVYCGGTIIEPHVKYTGAEVFGHLNNVHIGKYKTIFTNKHNDLETVSRANDLANVFTDLEAGPEKDLMRQRLEYLKGKVALIRVGGKSEVEMKERRDRIEDATLSVQCALEEGIVQGGGKALLLASMKMTDNRFYSCLSAPYNIIFKDNTNRDGSLKLDLTKNMFTLNIIDPLKVTRCALQNAISVAKTILGTSAMVLNEQLWK